MANKLIITSDYSILSPYANVDANYGPWSSISEYEEWLGATPLAGTLIAILDSTTNEISLKVYSNGVWKTVSLSSEESSDEPVTPVTPTDPDDSGDSEVKPVIPDEPEVELSSSLSITLSANPSNNLSVGDTVTFSGTVTNTGNVAVNSGTVYSTLLETNKKTFSLSSGNSVSFSYTYSVAQEDVDVGSINETVTANAVSSNSSVSNPKEVTASAAPKAVTASAKMSISKTAVVPNDKVVGVSIPYTVTVKNTGNVTLKNGVISDKINNVSLNIPNNTFVLSPGESKVASYNYTIQQSDITNGSIENTATASASAIRGNNPTNVSKTFTIKTQTINPTYDEEHEYVDLGLDSGTLWATCNLGAAAPADLGDLFAWGEIETKDTFSWSNYKYCNGTKTTLTKYCSNSSNWGGSGSPDGLYKLQSADDAAIQLWGDDWCMPSSTDLAELLGLRKVYKTYQYNNKTIVGMEFYNKLYGYPSMFLPICVLDDSNTTTPNICYWANNSNSQYGSSDANANYLLLGVDTETKTVKYAQTGINKARYLGYFIRPIRKK